MTVTAPIILIIAAVALYTRVWLPVGERASGNIVRAGIPVAVWPAAHACARVAALWLVAVLSAVLGWVNPLVALLAMAIAACVILVPVRYTLTSAGIRAGGRRSAAGPSSAGWRGGAAACACRAWPGRGRR